MVWNSVNGTEFDTRGLPLLRRMSSTTKTCCSAAKRTPRYPPAPHMELIESYKHSGIQKSTIINSVRPKNCLAVFPAFHLYVMGKIRSSCFLFFLQAFQIYRKSKKQTVDNYQCFTSFLKTAASRILQVFSK